MYLEITSPVLGDSIRYKTMLLSGNLLRAFHAPSPETYGSSHLIGADIDARPGPGGIRSHHLLSCDVIVDLLPTIDISS